MRLSVPGVPSARAAAVRPLAPVGLALLLSLAYVPFVALGLYAAFPEPGPGLGAEPVTAGQALLLALGSSLAAGLAGGLCGGLLVRRRPRLGALAAVAAAWAVGASALSVTAAAAGFAMEPVVECAIGCSGNGITQEPGSALVMYALSVMGSLLFMILVVPLLVVAGAAVALWRLRLWAAMNSAEG